MTRSLFRIRTLTTAIGVLALASPVGAVAQVTPAPEVLDRSYEVESAIFSRTSITVSSIEESLKLYRDILGLEPFYDRPGLSDPRLVGFSGMTPDQTMDLLVLRHPLREGARPSIGHLGLAQIRNADGSLARLPQASRSGATPGSMALLILVRDVMAAHEQVVASGYEVISAPRLREDGSLSQLLMRGPDGERLWISQSKITSLFLPEREG